MVPVPAPPLTLRIDRRFRGPDLSGNGGYTAGRLAATLLPTPGAAIEVTLRRPPPLERELRIERGSDDAEASARLLDGEIELCAARLAGQEADLDLVIPPPVDFAAAEALSARYVGHQRHGFPQCFVCGPARPAGDGLRIFAGRASDEPGALVAAPFVPDASLVDEHGQVRPEMLWAALDCVGYFGVAGPGTPPALLGRMTGALRGGVTAGTPCVVMGWGLGGERRKLFAGTALYAGDRLVGSSRQVWITL
jgi:hypothetical protein